MAGKKKKLTKTDLKKIIKEMGEVWDKKFIMLLVDYIENCNTERKLRLTKSAILNEIETQAQATFFKLIRWLCDLFF